MNHELKIWPEYYEVVRSGLKTFEIRKNDRGFQVGDTLLLREYDANSEEFTGRSITRSITYIVEGPPFMAEGWAVLGIAGNRQPVGITNLLKRSEEPIWVRAERMIDENQERNKEFRHVR